MNAKGKANLKLWAQLLPELYGSRSNYYLIISKTYFGINIPSNYRYLIKRISNWIPVIGHPDDHMPIT